MRGPVLLGALFVLVSGCFGASGPQDSGSSAPSSAPPNPPADPTLAQTGRWLPQFDPMEGMQHDGEEHAVPAIHMVHLGDGRVAYWSGLHAHDPTAIYTAGSDRAHSLIVDMLSDPPTVTMPTPADGGGSDLFCVGQALLPDGTALAAGGSVFSGPRGLVFYGSKDARILDPATGTWTMVGKMEFDRWYPAALSLPDGRVLLSSGVRIVDDPTSFVLQQEIYDPAIRDFVTMPPSADKSLPMYPRLFVVPSGPLAGDVYYQPAGCLWCPGGNEAQEATWNLDASLDLDTAMWTEYGPSVLGARQNPVTVMLSLRPPDYKAQLLSSAGTLSRSGVGIPFSEITDLSVVPPTHTMAAPMMDGRWFPQHVLLPDGQVLVAGGARLDGVLLLGGDSDPAPMVPAEKDFSSILTAELFDPAGTDPATGLPGLWKPAGEISGPRVYHSSAVLLADGRVLLGGSAPVPVGGTGSGEAYRTSFEIYEPPYLFRGARPVITDAPDQVTWGESFTITTPDVARFQSAVLVRTSAVTHVYNPEQRLIELVQTGQSQNEITLVAPPDAALAPPGTYMLFLLAQGEGGVIPSVASTMRIL